MIDFPTFVSQHGCDPAIAVTPELFGKRHYTIFELLFIIRYLPHVPLS